SEHYNATWLRDNYWCNMAYLNNDIEKYMQTCRTHINFLHKWENEYDSKISWLSKDTDVHKMPSRFIHPKVNFDGSEIKGLDWQFLQADSLFYIIIMLYNGWKYDSGIIANLEDRNVVQKLVDAIMKLDIPKKNLAHSWEEELACFTSNLGLGIKAINCAYEMGFEINHNVLKEYRLKFYSQFPYERSGREWDLTLLFLCVIDGILEKADIEEVLKGVHLNLEREYGVIRYKDDIYKPFESISCDTEMEWQMGFGYMALIYGRMGNKNMAMYYIDKLISRYPNGRIPEGTNNIGLYCDNTPLAWSVAMCIQAIDIL
ncbi:MAG: hypothetical protein ACRDD8_07995, partial [Bacteroidales bacterium]